MKKNELFSIPNLLSYFRLLLIPVYLIVYFQAKNAAGYRIAAAILILSAITDFLDGKIARRFHMITEWGKILDPIADKLTQAAVAISLAFRFPLMRTMVALLAVKELAMAAMGTYMLKRGKKMDGAQWYGKVSTTVFFVVMIVLIFFVDISYFVAGILIWISMIFMFLSLCCYTRLYYRMAKDLKQEKQGKTHTQNG